MIKNFYRNKYNAEVRLEGIRLLKATCRNIIRRSREAEGAYGHVKCSFKKANDLFRSIISHKRLFDKWLEQTEIFMEKGNDKCLRPVIDRIDEKGHYYLYNMQVLSLSENASKARKKN
ncbi:hypothetical protein ACFWGC_29540 [Cytobacillus pseudoceanisediminis]|uniref:hypothetical protein n=1 Tax=Bacillaceae TaxID=186817 RepID=UPI001A8C2D29|nr:hypothetical protein [Bacillus sp. NTK034]MBN8199180.1 hypothetical protein [Bacillus sp. NTK034]